MARRPSSAETVIIDCQEQVDELVRCCRAEERFAFDTEFVMEDRFEAEVCLLQIATTSQVAIVDPFLDLDLSAVWELICDSGVETVVHSGQEDLGLCMQHTGKIPQHIYDVQIAAGFVGHDYPLSLQKLVQTVLHRRLHKTKTLTDWRKRPLAASQIEYAAADVEYLLSVRTVLHDEIGRRGRLDWVEEELRKLEDVSLYRRTEEEKVFRVKGAGSMRGRQLAIVSELLAWREEVAKRLNRPARIVLKDHLLVEIARLELRSQAEIRDLRGINLSFRDVTALGRVVSDAQQIPSEQWPKPAPRDVETQEEAALIALATGVVRSYSLQHDLAYSLVASKKTIRGIVRQCLRPSDEQDGSVELLRGWRGETVGAVLQAVLRGERTIRIESADGRRVIRTAPT